MIVNQKDLLEKAPIKTMLTAKEKAHGMSHGLTECGYDVRIAQDVWVFLGRRFVLASTIEEFDVPPDLMGRVLNKSSWARQGLDASMTTNVEPGWRGFLTLELRYARAMPLFIPRGAGIAQVIFEQVSRPVQYTGKYQDQPAGPVGPR